MGKLVDGKWVEKSVITSDATGAYDRVPRNFLNQIQKASSQFPPEAGRYHLYVSYACPWATRTLIFRELKDLQDIISVSVVHPDMLEDGWSFSTDFKGATGDHLHNFNFLREVYQKADEKVSTTVTVPVLWDKKLNTIVNNESSEIIRMMNSEFNHLTGNEADYYPKELQSEIDEWNEKIYECVNNGVYKTGFAKTQEAYDRSVTALFKRLDEIDKHLEGKEYLVGEQLTEADIRLVVTLLRFDIVYVTHFKCNIKRIIDYKNLNRYTKRLYEIPAIKNTCHFDHIKRHYYYSHPDINPFQIIPKGPDAIF
jgi:putative glutathione S-transferase